MATMYTSPAEEAYLLRYTRYGDWQRDDDDDEEEEEEEE